ncbi:uncharacterized protein LOC131848496 [Achroia grisella]|uniref:uncharacterized protein LOC131848496 n=1 Tax=Achroia grisella TaxID=688607 RepID=UPI0027D23E33|nr:uncharacterized protein LOC131848496 [Achroia grisella]
MISFYRRIIHKVKRFNNCINVKWKDNLNHHCINWLYKMRVSKTTTTALITSWIILSMFYYNIYNLISYNNTLKNKFYDMQIDNNRSSHQFVNVNNNPQDILLNTPGCYIPNYGKKIIFKEADYRSSKCGPRAVSIKKVSDDEIVFLIDKSKLNTYTKNKHYSCCYKFVSRSTDPGVSDVKITYTSCVTFNNGTTIKLNEEVITVTCGVSPDKKFKVIYEDAYMLIKKKNSSNHEENNNKSWNVLLLGMDTMSRARAYYNLPFTMEYFQRQDWLDYRGYHKVGFNTYPNVMSLLTGNKVEKMYRKCKPNMNHCNDHIIWTKFKNAGFKTAYGEDNLSLPDTFYNYGGFESVPTDHYMRPLFLTGETSKGNVVCTKKMPSGKHILDYAHQFMHAYQDENFFGFFWINSYSHNLVDIPGLLDKHLVNLFENVSDTVLNNTFIIFLSDHGIRYGEMRYQMESYYEERLPMFFVWVPYEFRERHKEKYNNLQLNQYRLTTPYDLHATFWEILKMTNDSIDITKPAACPECTSIFEEKPPHRTCADAAIDKKWCGCHNLVPVDTKDVDVHNSLQLTISHIQNISQNVKTKDCMKCSEFTLKTVLRSHSYIDSAYNKKYYVVAFLLSPGDVGYEATVEKDNAVLTELQPTTTITQYNTRGNCVIKPNDRSYCVCEKVPKCFKKHKTK